MSFGSGFKKALPMILGIASDAGIIVTASLAIRDTLKCQKKLEELDIKAQMEGRELTRKEKIFIVIKNYIPTVVSGLCTIGCNTTGFIISKQSQTKLAAIASGSTIMLNRLKDTIRRKYGDNDIKDIIASEGEYVDVEDLSKKDPTKNLYFNEYTGFFWADPEKFGLAFNEISTDIWVRGFTTIDRFLIFADAEVDKKYDYSKDALINEGWSVEYLEDMFAGDYSDMRIYPEFEYDQDDTEIIRHTKNGIPYKPFIFGPVDPIWDSIDYDAQEVFDGGYPRPWEDPRILKFDEKEEAIISGNDGNKKCNSEHIY